MNTETVSRPRFPNPIPSIFLFFVVTLASGVLLVTYFSLNPDIVGLARTEQLGQDVYQFESLHLDRPRLSVEFQTGTLIPLYRGDEITGALVMGSGSYLFEPGPAAREQLLRETGRQELHDSLSAMYVPADFESFENMVYRARAKGLPNQAALDRAAEYLERIQHTSTTVETYGIRRDWNTNPNVLQLFGVILGRVSYAATDSITLNFVDIDGLELVVGDAAGVSVQSVPSALYIAPRFLLTYLVLTILCLFLVFVLTVDTVSNEHLSLVRATKMRLRRVAYAILMLSGVALELGVAVLLERSGMPFSWVTAWRIGSAIIILVYAWWFVRAPALLGLTNKYWRRAILLGAIIGAIAFICGTLQLPAGLKDVSPEQFLQEGAWALLISGYANELFKRGFLQAHAEVALGRRWGLVLVSFLLGAVYLGTQWFLSGTPTAAELVQGIAIVPASNLLLGYMFQRTGTIHASAIAAGLMAFLPQAFRF